MAKTLLDGKMVMIKSTNKVIKIQHGTVNKLDSPIEILLPQLRFSFSNIKDIVSVQVSYTCYMYKNVFFITRID